MTTEDNLSQRIEAIIGKEKNRDGDYSTPFILDALKSKTLSEDRLGEWIFLNNLRVATMAGLVKGIGVTPIEDDNDDWNLNEITSIPTEDRGRFIDGLQLLDDVMEILDNHGPAEEGWKGFIRYGKRIARFIDKTDFNKIVNAYNTGISIEEACILGGMPKEKTPEKCAVQDLYGSLIDKSESQLKAYMDTYGPDAKLDYEQKKDLVIDIENLREQLMILAVAYIHRVSILEYLQPYQTSKIKSSWTKKRMAKEQKKVEAGQRHRDAVWRDYEKVTTKWRRGADWNSNVATHTVSEEVSMSPDYNKELFESNHNEAVKGATVRKMDDDYDGDWWPDTLTKTIRDAEHKKDWDDFELPGDKEAEIGLNWNLDDVSNVLKQYRDDKKLSSLLKTEHKELFAATAKALESVRMLDALLTEEEITKHSPIISKNTSILSKIFVDSSVDFLTTEKIIDRGLFDKDIGLKTIAISNGGYFGERFLEEVSSLADRLSQQVKVRSEYSKLLYELINLLRYLVEWDENSLKNWQGADDDLKGMYKALILFVMENNRQGLEWTHYAAISRQLFVYHTCFESVDRLKTEALLDTKLRRGAMLQLNDHQQFSGDVLSEEFLIELATYRKPESRAKELTGLSGGSNNTDLMNEWSDEFLKAVGGEENAAKIMQLWLSDLKNYHDFAFDDFYIPEWNEDPFGDELIDKLAVLIKGYILGRIANRVSNGERAGSVGIRITVDSNLADDKGEKSYARSSANRNKERLNFGQYYG